MPADYFRTLDRNLRTAQQLGYRSVSARRVSHFKCGSLKLQVFGSSRGFTVEFHLKASQVFTS